MKRNTMYCPAYHACRALLGPFYAMLYAKCLAKKNNQPQVMQFKYVPRKRTK